MYFGLEVYIFKSQWFKNNLMFRFRCQNSDENLWSIQKALSVSMAVKKMLLLCQSWCCVIWLGRVEFSNIRCIVWGGGSIFRNSLSESMQELGPVLQCLREKNVFVVTEGDAHDRTEHRRWLDHARGSVIEKRKFCWLERTLYCPMLSNMRITNLFVRNPMYDILIKKLPKIVIVVRIASTSVHEKHTFRSRPKRQYIF